LKSRALDAVVLGGLHTDFEPEVIQGLEASGRLFARDNLDAVIPGECAAFVVLMREPDAARYELPALARLRGIGDGRDGVRIDNTASAYEAFGLAAAARAATKSLGESEQTAGWVLTDLTHEMWRQKEWQSVFVRLQRVLGNPYYIDSPAQRMGQLGGAALPLLMTIAATAWQYDYAPSPRAILLGTSKGGGRAALTLENMMSRAEEITP
jgi:3-oxoacyl-[acyl-carrier-protein] synthase-1